MSPAQIAHLNGMSDADKLKACAERVVARLPSGRCIMATFVAITPAEMEHVHEGLRAPEIAPPSFMDVVEACELIGQGSCRPFESLRQLTG
jgi:hypothetical protein